MNKHIKASLLFIAFIILNIILTALSDKYVFTRELSIDGAVSIAFAFVLSVIVIGVYMFIYMLLDSINNSNSHRH